MGIQTLQVNRTRKLQETNYIQKIFSSFNPLASEASKEVASLTERKNPHTPVYVVFPSVTMRASSKNGVMGLFRLDADSVLRLKSNF